MASRSICITAIAVFAVFGETTDGAPADPERSCNEDYFESCLQRKTEFLTNEAQANDMPAIIEKMCRVKVKPCTEILPLDKCPEDFKTQIFALEKSFEVTFDALCEKDATLFKDLAKTLDCWRPDDFISCVGTINVTALGLDLLTPKRSQETWDNFNAELLKCIDHARYESEKCNGSDVGPVQEATSILVRRLNRLYNASGRTSAASVFPAFISLLVCLAFSRQR